MQAVKISVRWWLRREGREGVLRVRNEDKIQVNEQCISQSTTWLANMGPGGLIRAFAGWETVFLSPPPPPGHQVHFNAVSELYNSISAANRTRGIGFGPCYNLSASRLGCFPHSGKPPPSMQRSSITPHGYRCSQSPPSLPNPIPATPPNSHPASRPCNSGAWQASLLTKHLVWLSASI